MGPNDNTNPKWIKKPKSAVVQGAFSGRLELEVSDDSSVFYEVVMKTVKRKEQRFIVMKRYGSIRLSGFCQETFSIPKKKKMRVKITPVDFAGNRGKTKTLWISSK